MDDHLALDPVFAADGVSAVHVVSDTARIVERHVELPDREEHSVEVYVCGERVHASSIHRGRGESLQERFRRLRARFGK